MTEAAKYSRTTFLIPRLFSLDSLVTDENQNGDKMSII